MRVMDVDDDIDEVERSFDLARHSNGVFFGQHVMDSHHNPSLQNY
jgi:hypothetical protein